MRDRSRETKLKHSENKTKPREIDTQLRIPTKENERRGVMPIRILYLHMVFTNLIEKCRVN